jgi:hypothetical protein
MSGDVVPVSMVQVTAESHARKEVEFANLKMRYEMAEEYVDKLRASLRETEDKLQDARKMYFTVEIGE